LKREQESLWKKHQDSLNQLQTELESEISHRKEKYAMQLSKTANNQSFENLDENEEKRELAVI
jgi:hypothetical protein